MVVSKQDWRRFLPDFETGDFQSRWTNAFAGQTVCVAGAGGDIGSALVKALQVEDLRSLILLDSSEHGLFEMQRYMESAHPSARCEYIAGSVDDAPLLDDVLGRWRPQIVFHAAAFKHVALLEHNAFSAIQNNALGTYTLLRAALAHGVSTFVLLSTDKAVNPHSVMGVSKRIAELITVSLSRADCHASAIRLGNVIGSRGSVTPIFLEQIASGRPVIVTHPQASRYFLSRREAVSAILAAGTAGCDGAILIPDLGEPVLVAELARYLIEKQGRKGSSAVVFSELRPGEKVAEELLGKHERPSGSIEGGSMVLATGRLSPRACDDAVRRLSACVAERNHRELLRLLCELVPEYKPSKVMQDHAA